MPWSRRRQLAALASSFSELDDRTRHHGDRIEAVASSLGDLGQGSRRHAVRLDGFASAIEHLDEVAQQHRHDMDAALARLEAIDHRLDALRDAVVDRLEAPTFDDLLEVRAHGARVAAELARLEVNLAARLEAVRDRLKALEAAEQPTGRVVDLRVARAEQPTDTAWSAPLTG